MFPPFPEETMKTPFRSSRPVVAWLAVVAVLGIVAWGCSKNPLGTESPVDVSSNAVSSGAIVLSPDNPEVASVMAVQDRYTSELMRVPGVVGVATGLDPASGRAAIKVYTERALAPGQLKKEYEGVKVVEEVTGRIVAMKGRPGGGGTSHTAIQTPPISLGTSGGPVLDLANGYCCGGTLGSLVSKGGSQYILSNSHVLAGDVVSGGNGRVSTIGDDIGQPGLIDVNCSATGAQIVADLSTTSSIYPPNNGSNVDCSIAQVRSGMVRTDGAILEIGTISSSTTAAFVGQAVKKSGRTTGLSRSSVSGLNATISVGYSDECAGSSFTKTYTGQIVISNSGSKFLNSGDSGSLMVEDIATNPRAVGLLYAGSSTAAIANPIGPVLSFLGATMVGN
jgi:hypothetical protein